ncbi:MAG: hypothetical protein OXG08_04230 [Gammaproteobacteria bacterium]|nr:hypothetical protein [Gammaproteobacteria bacterium]
MTNKSQYQEFIDELWGLLNEETLVSRMKLLSRRGISAIAALDTDAEEIWEILRRARAIGIEDPIKQATGKMVRRILESDEVGFVHVDNARVNSWIFSSGAKYRHPDWRPLYVHRNRDPRAAEEFCISRRKRLGELASLTGGASSWIYFRRCLLEHELEYILDAWSLQEFEWNDIAEELNWRSLCRNVRSRGYIVLRRIRDLS